MTERIDYASEALRVLMLPTKFEDATEANALAYAQVHATLALVEQQRIANIIAFTIGAGYRTNQKTIDEIAKGLGL